MDIIKRAGGIRGGVLVRDLQYTKIDQQVIPQKILRLPNGNKITFQWLKSRWHR